MSWIKDERTEVATLLGGAGFTAFDHVPSRPIPPFAMVVPGSPYLEGGDTFGGKTLRFDVWVIAGQGDTSALSDALDDQIVTAIAALEADDLHVESVSQPIEWKPSTGGTFLATVIGTALEVTPPTP